MRAGLYLFLIIGFFLIASCKKDKNEPVVVKDFTIEALTYKSWKPVQIDGNTSVNPPAGTYLYYAVQSWDRDDDITYKTDSKVYYNYGTLLSPPGIETPNSKTYSVDFIKKIIVIGGTTYQLLELSSTRLKYSLSVSPIGINSNYLIFIFEHP